MFRLAIATLSLFFLLLPGTAAALTIFAASSTGPLFEKLAEDYRKDGGNLRGVYAASSALAKQIEQGAPADLFVSANPGWVRYLEEKESLLSGSKEALFQNSLVVVVPADSAVTAPLKDLSTLADLLGDGRLAVGDPDFVPAGLYARQALETEGLWQGLAPRFARSANVRAALALVESGEAAAGIVYATDAHNNPKVRQIYAFPAHSHDPVVYEMALPKGSNTQEVETFLSYLKSDPARRLIRSFGFHPVK
ncbi:molybdate ABC transporter substrate-binding protein [Rhodovibrionaceae bacterium A322]